VKFPAGFHYKKASEPLYKTPKSIQETIEIMAVAENGIFEVSKNKYSKCYRFQDINYTTATEDEQIGIFERYCKFLNSLDCNYKITINNKNKNMDELRDKVLIAEKNDGFNNYRRIYNDIIEEKIIEGRQGIEQERYLTITIERKNFEEAKVQFATLEAAIHNPDIGWETADEYLSGNVRDKLKLSGGDIKAVQGDSGHAQADMVTEVYGHILDEDRKKNAQLIKLINRQLFFPFL
jgi:ComB4 competence protein